MTNPYPNQPPAYPPPPTPAPKAKKSKTWVWILGIVVAFVLGLSIGSSGNNTTTAGPATAVTATAPAGGAVTATEKSAPPAPPAAAGPKTEFGDGTYKVGEDIAAGSYKSAGPREGSAVPNCYWARKKDDSGSLDSIIANNGGAGATRITVKKGEYLEVSGCDFVKA